MSREEDRYEEYMRAKNASLGLLNQPDRPKPCTICCKPIGEDQRCTGCGSTERYINWWFAIDEIKIVDRLKEKTVFDIDKAYDAGLAAIHRIAVGHGISIEEAAVCHIKRLRGYLGI